MQKLLALTEKEKEKEKTIEKFNSKLSSKLAAAATAKSWSDLLPIMKDIYSFLKINNTYNFDKIVDKLLLGKRLAQSLNPECPGGLHEVTLDVYEILLKNIMTQNNNKLMENLHVYAYGLFPFFPNATIPNKQKFLEKIVKGVFYKLNRTELKLCLPGLLSSLIPGLDDNNEDTTKFIYSSFNELVKIDKRNFFGVYWMLLLRCKHLRNSGIKYLLENTTKYKDISDENKKNEVLENEFPNINTTVINALCEIIKEPEVPLLRNGMDFITSRLPLTKDNTMLTDEAKITLINGALFLLVKNEASTVRRLKNWILGLMNQDDEPDYENDDMKYKLGLVIKAFENIFKQDKNLDRNFIKDNILIFERFLDLEEEFVTPILSNTSYLVLKAVVNYWEKNFDSQEGIVGDPIIAYIIKFFNKKNFFESLWNSLASNIIKVTNSENLNDLNIDETLSPLKFCLYYMEIKTNEERVKYYIPIIDNILNLINKIPINRDQFKNIKKIILIALAYIKSLQEKKFHQNEEDDHLKNIADELKNKESNNFWTLMESPTIRKSVMVEINNEINNVDQNNEDIITDVYQINDEFNLNSILNYDKNILDNLSKDIIKFQEYFIGILNLFLNTENTEGKINPITRADIAFFRQISELTIRLQEYSQTEENEIPKWVKYLEKIIFNFNINNNDNLLQIEATNILLDLNLSFNNKDDKSIYTKIRNNFKSDEIDENIIDIAPITEIRKNMKVNNNCYELLLAKFYLLTNKQIHMNNNMQILFKIYNFDKNKFADIINDTINTTENLYENIRLFSNFWKSVNENYQEHNLFKKETIFKMIDFLEDKNPTLRHLSKTWLNQANQCFDKIIDPILMELLNKTILCEFKKEKNFEKSEFTKEFAINEILDSLTKLKNIIINSQIMTFFKIKELKTEIFNLIKFEKYNVKKMNYLQTIICISLLYIKTKAKDNLKEDFIKDVFVINTTSTEFLEFLLKNINDYDFLIENTNLINNIILHTLMKSLDEKDEVMSVQLLDVLKSLYFNYPLQAFKNSKKNETYIELLLNSDLEKVIKEGLAFEHFYLREHFISFTKKLVESFFNAIGIENKLELRKFYQSCNRFIEPLSNMLEKKVVLENKIKIDTEKFSHYDSKNSMIVYKNYCEEYKEYKTYDEGEVLSILKGINDILFNCFKNQIQEKNKELATDKGITFFYIPITFIKKKTVRQNDFQNWPEHKKKLINDTKSNNAFVSFFTTAFDFVDENPNAEIKDMSTDLYHSQILNLLNSFLSIWINQSDSYERFDYCLNSNGILAYNNSDPFKNLNISQISEAFKNIKENSIKSAIIQISTQLFITDSIKFIENILGLWTKDYNDDGINKNKDKQLKLSIIELLIAMNIPLDIILFCVGFYLQKTFENNNTKKTYVKSKPDKCYITPLEVSVREAKIFHFIYSYILLNPNTITKRTEEKKMKITEIWKEIINIMNNTLNESKILNSYCWLYEILFITARKYSLNNIEAREIKNGIENIFNNLTTKLTDAVFAQKYDSKYINDSKLTLPYLPHLYTNITKELYKEDDLYHKNLEGGKSGNLNRKTSLKHTLTNDSTDKKLALFKSVSDEAPNVRSKTLLTHSVIQNTKTQLIKHDETPTNVNKFYLHLVKIPKTSNEFDTDKDNLVNKEKLNTFYKLIAFITLKENFYPLIRLIFEDNIKIVAKYYNDIISKLLDLIRKTKSSKGEGNFLSEFSHQFLADLMEKSPDNTIACGKDALIEHIKSPILFEGTLGELRDWRNILKILSEKYKDILKDLIKDMSDKNIFVKKTAEEKSQILRRISFVIYSCENDKFTENFALIKSKAKKLLSDLTTDNDLEREIFLLLRMLFLRFSHDAVMQMIRDLWPIIFSELVKNIDTYIKASKGDFKLVIEPIKFLELLSLVNIEEFSLYQWIFLMDTFDIKDCDVRNNSSLCKFLMVDSQNLFKPMIYTILKDDILNLNEKVITGSKKAKNTLIIDADNNTKFKNQLYQFFYSIGDMNSFKVEPDFDQFAENIEKDFMGKTEEKKQKK